MKESVQPLVEEYNLISVLTGCMEDNDADVRQAAFGVLGDLAQYCYVVVKPHVKTFVMLCVKYMNVEYDSEYDFDIGMRLSVTMPSGH